MKKVILSTMLAVLAFVVLFSSCAQPTPTPAPVPSPTPSSPSPAPSPAPSPTPSQPSAPASAPAPKPIVLKWSSFSTPDSVSATTVWLLDELELRTQGRLKIERYWGGALVPQRTEAEGVGAGIADMTTVGSQYVKARLSLIDIATQPGAGPTQEKHGVALNALYNRIPAIREQFEKSNLRFITALGGSPSFVFTNFPIAKVDDLKGKKIRVSGDAAKAISAAGGVVVGLSSAEMYEALERGTIEGVVIGLGGGNTWRVFEATEYLALLPVFNSSFYIFMNKAKWESLPPDIQQIIDKTASELPAVFVMKRGIEDNNNLYHTFPAAGVQVVSLSPSEIAKMNIFSRPLLNTWAEKQNLAGLPGTEVLNEWLKLAEIQF